MAENRPIIARSNGPPEQGASASESSWHSVFDIASSLFEQALKVQEMRERVSRRARHVDYPKRASEARRV
jgi:hypothetical protein